MKVYFAYYAAYAGRWVVLGPNMQKFADAGKGNDAKKRAQELAAYANRAYAQGVASVKKKTS